MSMLMDMFTVASMAAAPILELRAAIPVGIHSFHLHPALAALAAIVGNMIPAVLIIFFLEPFVHWLSRYIPWLHRFVDVWLVRSRKKVQPEIEKYGILGLIIFIGIPLPMTGAWTGAVGAVLMGLSKKKALLACLGGVVMAAIVVLIITLGSVSIFKFLIN